MLLKSGLSLRSRVCVHLARQSFLQKLPVWIVLNNEVNGDERHHGPGRDRVTLLALAP